MLQAQIGWFTSLLSLALLLTACQPASEPVPLPPQETTISQAAVASPTILPTPTHRPFPTVTPSPTATPTLARTSQGDQLPTRSPTSPPTPTAIPAEEPVPSTIATRPRPTPTLATPSEVDLSALEESLVLLDRLDRRQGKPTPTPVGPIIFEGLEYVTMDTCAGGTYGESQVGSGRVTRIPIVLKVEGNNVSGIFYPGLVTSGDIPFAGTHNSLTGERKWVRDQDVCGLIPDIFSIQAILSEDGRKFEGTWEGITSVCFIPHKSLSTCKLVTAFSLTRK